MAAQPSDLHDKYCELHAYLRLPMRLCRWAGVFPVDGLDKKTITELRYNVKSAYIVYNVATLLFQTILLSLTVYYFFTNDLDLYRFANLLFYLTGLMSAMFLLKLAKSWQKLMSHAEKIESRVAAIRIIKINRGRKSGTIACFVMLLALVERILSAVFKLKFVMDCYQHFEINLDLIRLYFLNTSSFIFKFISYSEWKAVIYELGNLQATFLWNFTDAVTICVSLYLVSYFQDLNKFIELKKKQKIIINWKEIRIYYSYLVELVNEIDQSLCYLILLSFFTNLFFVCVQLFYLMNRSYPNIMDCAGDHLDLIFHSVEYSVYYGYSFLFLFTRATVTSLLAANVNTVARRPLLALQDVPSSDYTIEVQRFLRQIRYTAPALSGLYFYITRGMILTVMSAVIRYELVLLQFNSK